MIDFCNETDFELALTIFEKIANSKTDKEIEFVLTDNESIQDLNRQFRGKDEPTDVISFPYEEMLGAPLGSIIVSIDFAKDKAKTLGHKVEDEIALLFTHGLLHILGYDHEIDNGEQRTEEERILTSLNLPKSLIVRNS